jgi:hypothetical protein
MQLSKNLKIEYAYALIASANNTDVNTTIFDMSGWDGIMFITHITTGAAAGVATLNVKAHTANSAGGTTITGATATVTNGSTYAGKNLIVDVYKPLKRYVYGNITSGTDVITFGQTHAILYRAKMGPTPDGDTLAAKTAVIGS